MSKRFAWIRETVGGRSEILMRGWFSTTQNLISSNRNPNLTNSQITNNQNCVIIILGRSDVYRCSQNPGIAKEKVMQKILLTLIMMMVRIVFIANQFQGMLGSCGHTTRLTCNCKVHRNKKDQLKRILGNLDLTNSKYLHKNQNIWSCKHFLFKLFAAVRTRGPNYAACSWRRLHIPGQISHIHCQLGSILVF